MITEKELIYKIQSLKQIKPNQNWVVLTKNRLLSQSARPNFVDSRETSYGDIVSNVLSVLFQRKLAYALAVLLFVFAGTFGVLKIIPQDQIVEKSPAALTAIQSEVEAFKVKSKILSEAARYSPESVEAAAKEVKDAAKELAQAIQENPELAKEVALEVNNNKTYLEITGSDELEETASDLYKTVVEPILSELNEKKEAKLLTESQKSALESAQKVYDSGNYVGALEDVLLLINSSDIFESNK